jgi:hypothetical protein
VPLRQQWGIPPGCKGKNALLLLRGGGRPDCSGDGHNSPDYLRDEGFRPPAFGDDKPTGECEDVADDSKCLRLVHFFPLIRLYNVITAMIRQRMAVVSLTHASRCCAQVTINPVAEARIPVTPLTMVWA